MTSSYILYASSLFAYTMLYGISWYASGRRSDKIADVLYREGCEYLLIKKQCAGILVLLIPVAFCFLCMHEASWLLNTGPVTVWVYGWVPALFFSIILGSAYTTAFVRAVKKQHVTAMRQAPQVIYFAGRVVFLFLYEVFFRGILLFSLIQLTGYVVAVAVSIVLYAALHLHCSKKELVSTIPFGLVAAVLCIWANSIWPAVLLHIIVSLTAELDFVLSANKPYKLYVV